MSADLVHAYEWDTPDTQLFVGLGLGRDEVFVYEWQRGNSGSRVHDFDVGDLVRCFDYSPVQPLLVGYGLGSGNVYIRDVSRSSAAAVFKQRVVRKSTSISFNSTGLVAAGFEKTRGADSVMLWDLSAGDAAHEPVMSVFSNEFVSSVAFVPSQPTTLLCGGAKLIREVDTRTSGAISAIATNFAKGIVVNPLNDYVFATYGDAGPLAIWDRRMLTGATNEAREPQLLVSNVFKSTSKSESRSVRFSPVNENEFGVLQDGAIIRRWQTSHIPDTQRRATQTSHLSMELHSGSSPAAGAGAGDAAAEHLAEQKLDALFVNKVFDVKTEADKVAAFDYARNMRTGDLEFVCIRQSGTVFRMPVTEPPMDIHFDAFNNFDVLLQSSEVVEANAILGGPGRNFDLTHHARWRVAHDLDASAPAARSSQLSARRSSQGMSDMRSGVSAGSMASEDEDEDESAASEDDDDESSYAADDMNISVMLEHDITTVLRRRALAGYGFDPVLNVEIVKETSGHRSTASSGLIAAWRWVKLHKLRSEDADLAQANLDLSYLGVLSVWDGLTEEALRPRLATGAKLSSKTVDDAVKLMLKSAKNSVYVSVQGEDDAYRQMCLRLSGWNFGLQELEARLVELEAHGHYEKAAGWAVFHNNVERAVESLAKSRKKNLRLMSSAVAGYLVYKDVPTNNVWREQCRRLASELSAPYLRAIFAYIADGSWLDVLDDGSLPLTERLGIALRFLPQKEVGAYLTRLTSRAIANGDLEGIILTGFTPKVLDLFQSYLDRTSDIQTVCLIASFGWPRFLDDERVPQWISEYRELLNAWRYFSQRARFDIGRNKLALAGLPPATPAVRRQVFLRCSNCKNIITKPQKTDDGSSGRKKAAKTEDLQWSWNRCPSCNHTLPPCGVCGLPLGPHAGAEIESDRWPTFCLSCNHGSHSAHAREWFSKYDICPIPTCKCLCGKSLRIA